MSQSWHVVGICRAFVVLWLFPCMNSDRSYPTAKTLGTMLWYHGTVRFHPHSEYPNAVELCYRSNYFESFPHLRKPDSAHNVIESVCSSTACHARLIFEEGLCHWRLSSTPAGIFADQHVRPGCRVSIIYLSP
ncbi:hypothetical protein F5141DRAFT_290299 [Pisolithus sp. B1]|nr:hypothetical protein F5141DRAFT_290299 [Pisolithus sp. B1]